MNILKNITNAFGKVKKIIVYYYLFLKFKIKTLFLHLYNKYIHRYSFAVLSIVYFTLIIIISFYILKLANGSILSEGGIRFFTASGAMFGSALAIVFSLTILLIQNAAQRSSAGFFDLVAKDKFQSAIYWVITFFIFAFFSLAIIFTSSSNIFSKETLNFLAQGSLIVVGLVFWLLYFLFRRIREKIKPNNNLKIIESSSYEYLNKIKKLASEVAVLYSSKPSESGEPIDKSLAEATAYRGFQSYFSDINNRLDYLFDFHDKLYNSQEKKMARNSLTTAYKIILKYFSLRSESSLVVPSADVIWVGVSDSQSFLTPNLENFVSRGEFYINKNDSVGVTHIINILKSLAINAQNIKYVGPRQRSNPIFSQCRGYLDSLLVSAVKNNNMEAMFQGVRAYQEIIPVMIANGCEQDLYSVYNILDKIAFHCISNRLDVVWKEVIKVYDIILQALVLKSITDRRLYLRNYFDHISSITLFVFLNIRTKSIQDIYASVELDSIFYRVSHLANVLYQIAQKEKNDKRDNTQLTFVRLIEEYRRCLREISEKIKTADHALVETFAKTIIDISCLMVNCIKDEKWNKQKEELIRILGWYLHQPSWFTHEVKKIESNLHFDKLVEAVSVIGIISFDVNQDKLAEDAIEILFKLAMDMFEKESDSKYGYTEPRIMERACYIGILALKNKKKDIVENLKVNLKVFQQKFEEYYFSNLPEGVEPTSPKKELVRVEVMQLRDEFYKNRREADILKRAEHWLIERVEITDIDWFTFEMWNMFDASSPISEKIEKKENDKKKKK